MYNKTIIRFGFCDIRNNQGLGKCYQPRPSARLIIQSNLAISNSVNSKSPLFWRKIECPWIYPSPLRFLGYFEAPLFRTFFHFPWDFEIAGFDCNYLDLDYSGYHKNLIQWLFLVYTKTVDSVFRALWLATQSVNILHYSLIYLQFLRASDAKLA